jgi:hypothetical protein
MRAAVIVVTIWVAATPSVASESCMSRAEARQHFPSLHIYWHGLDHCWGAAPAGRYQIRRVQRKSPIPEARHDIDRPKIDQPAWRESMSEMLPDDSSVNVNANTGPRWLDRWVEIETSPLVAQWVDISRVASPQGVTERKAEPLATPRGALLVLICFVLTLGIVEVLFRRTIYQRRTEYER